MLKTIGIILAIGLGLFFAFWLLFGIYMAVMGARTSVKYDPNATKYDKLIKAVPGEYSIVVKLHPKDFIGRVQERFGYLDAQGKTLTPVRYSVAGDFIEGRALVRGEMGMGYIDRSGKEVIPLIYQNAGPFRNGKALVERGGQGQSGVGLINREGKALTDFRFKRMSSVYSEGMYAVSKDVSNPESRNGIEQEELWGFIDDNGKEVVPLRYSAVDQFVGGHAVVAKLRDGLTFYGLVNRKGEEVIAPQYFALSFDPQDPSHLNAEVFLSWRKDKVIPLVKRGKVSVRNEVISPFVETP